MKIAFVGKGALGLLYAPIAQRTLGRESVCFVMDDARYERHKNDVYTVNGEVVELRDVRASEAAAEGPFDLILLTVKSTGLKSALELVRSLMSEETIVIPLLNGVTSEAKCAEALGWRHVLGCVSYGMDAARFGTGLQYANVGEIVIGCAHPDTPPEVLERADKLLSESGIPHSVSDDIRHRLWSKLIANVGLNQVCAVYQVTYEDLFEDELSEIFRMYVGAMREVVAVANAEGIPLTEADLNGYVKVARGLDPKSMPSMAQDRVNKNPCEVDEFAGEIIRLAEKHGILVPCNRYLLHRVREYESEY